MSRSSNAGNEVLKEALRLRSLGVSVLPIGTGKKPALKSWKGLQTVAADEPTIRGWYAGPGIGLGIVLGPVSGGLVVRDFDIAESYQAWKQAYPDLAAKLPTVRTKRGYHVYSRVSLRKTLKYGDGELRGVGSYVVAPPSAHPDGGQYAWVIPLVTLDAVPLLEVDDTGFNREWGGTESHVCGLVGKPVSVPVSSPVCEPVSTPVSTPVPATTPPPPPPQRPLPPEAIRAIEQSLPTSEGTRNAKLFELARLLKASPQCRSTDPKSLKPIVREWHRLALPFIKTKDFDDSWSDFRIAWTKAKFPKWGISPAEILREVDAGPLPVSAMDYDHPNLRRLVKLCQVLQRHAGDAAFLLACRTAEAWLGINYKTANKWTQLLTLDGVISVDTHGTTTKAARYRYHGD